MSKARSWVGLDVHAHRSHASVLDAETGGLRRRRLEGPPAVALEYLQTLPGPVRAVYEAGPTGYGLARLAAAAGIDVRVCAPGLIPRKPTDRVKTDPRDADRLARLLHAGELGLVWVPSVEQEQLRDLVRAREDLRQDLMAPVIASLQVLPAPRASLPGAGRGLERGAHAVAGAARVRQRRLHQRWTRLGGERRKPGGQVAVACARELCCFLWEAAVID